MTQEVQSKSESLKEVYLVWKIKFRYRVVEPADHVCVL